MNRTMVRFTGAAVAAAAVLALSAPVFADGGHGRGGHFSTGGQSANGSDRGGNRGGGNSGGNRGGGGNQASGASGGRSNSDSGRNSGGSRYHGASGAEPANRSGGAVNAGGGAPRYGNGALRPGNGGSRNIDRAESANSSRYRGRMPSGGAVNGGVTERNLSNSNLPNPPAANGNGSSFRSRGNFANDRSSRDRSSRDRSAGDRHYATPHVPGVPASGRYSYLDRGHRPGFVHSRPSRVWYGNRPYWGWNGGYWRGSFWPRAYYRPGFIGFVTLLPPVYSTYWYGGVSYYYANDLYYTWDPNRYGYAVANPPPVVEEASSYSTAPDTDDQDEGQGPGSLFVYPRNGQSEEQTAQDRFECHQWAVDQTGFDPTVGEAQSSSAGNSEDYHRAIIACLDGRGYSAN